MSLASASIVTDVVRDDRPALVSAALRPGCDRAALSRYGDTIWDLGPAVFRENARRCHVTVHFDTVEDAAAARALREYLYARLNIDLPGYRTRLPPAGIRQAFNRARRFFEFVRAELGACDLARVDQVLLDRYAKSLREGRLRPVIAAQLLASSTSTPIGLRCRPQHYRSNHGPAASARRSPAIASSPARTARRGCPRR